MHIKVFSDNIINPLLLNSICKFYKESKVEGIDLRLNFSCDLKHIIKTTNVLDFDFQVLSFHKGFTNKFIFVCDDFSYDIYFEAFERIFEALECVPILMDVNYG